MRTNLIFTLLLFAITGANSQPKAQNTFVATFKYFECGDYCHLVFKEDNGKEWDFGQGDNDLSSYKLYIETDEDENASNPKYVGKKFKITWQNKKVKAFVGEGSMEVIKTELPSIIKLELIIKGHL